jgi:hypothetical protein
MIRQRWITATAFSVCLSLCAACAVADDDLSFRPAETLHPVGWETYGNREPVSTHCCCCSSGLQASFDWIYWNARRDGMDYATWLNPVWLTPVAADSLNLDRNSGVRVGLGYGFRSGWDVAWNYTYFDTDDATSVNTADRPGSVLISSRSFFDFTVQEVAARASLNCNVHDLEVGRCLPMDETMGMRFFGGFRWAMIDQTFDSRYVYRDDGGSRTGAIHNSTDMEAYGVRVGAEGRWQCRYGFGIFARGAVSVLAGTFETVLQEVDEVDGVISDFANTSTRAVPVVEAAAGVGWKRGCWDVRVGYELNSWFNMAQVNRASYDLLLDGLFARVSFSR